MGLSTHVLNTSSGLPASDVAVHLERLHGQVWQPVTSDRTDADGRCKALLSDGAELEPGRYRVRFEIGVYFATLGLRSLYPYVEVVIEITERRHYHIPLLLTANGYTTYRGS